MWMQIEKYKRLIEVTSSERWILRLHICQSFHLFCSSHGLHLPACNQSPLKHNLSRLKTDYNRKADFFHYKNLSLAHGFYFHMWIGDYREFIPSNYLTTSAFSFESIIIFHSFMRSSWLYALDSCHSDNIDKMLCRVFLQRCCWKYDYFTCNRTV